MRAIVITVVSAAWITAAGPMARADDCVNTRINNPAFASPYIEAAKPCPVSPTKPVAPLKQVDRPRPASGVFGVATHAGTTPPPADPDHATVTKTNTGTLLKFGDTTVCVSGSISMEVSTGTGGHHHGSPGDPNAPACN